MLSSRRMRAALGSWVPSCFASFKEMFSVMQKVGWVLWLVKLKSYIWVWPKFNHIYTVTKQHRFTDLRFVRTSVIKRHNALRHVPVRAFLDREFPGRWIGTGEPSPLAPLISKFYFSGFFLLGVCKRHRFSWKVQNVNELLDTIIRAEESFTNEIPLYLMRNWILSWCVLCH